MWRKGRIDILGMLCALGIETGTMETQEDTRPQRLSSQKGLAKFQKAAFRLILESRKRNRAYLFLVCMKTANMFRKTIRRLKCLTMDQSGT
jgi:hypothetical protein